MDRLSTEPNVGQLVVSSKRSSTYREQLANPTANLSASDTDQTSSLCPPFTPPTSLMPDFTHVLPSEVVSLIRLAPGKTSPLDIIPISVLKECRDEMATVISHIASMSFRSGKFPASMRSGLVTPLLKKPGLDADDYKNFRPITNLSTVSKIIERLALARLKPQITSSPNFCRLQSAYHQGH